MRFRPLFGASLLAVFLLAGCDGDPSRQVTGTVTFDGKPVPDGQIIFVDAAGKQAPDAGKITDGKFAFKVTPGSKKVQVQASRMEKLSPGKKGAMGETEAPVSYIPARYDADTKLTAEVTDKGPNEFEFKLEK